MKKLLFTGLSSLLIFSLLPMGSFSAETIGNNYVPFVITAEQQKIIDEYKDDRKSVVWKINSVQTKEDVKEAFDLLYSFPRIQTNIQGIYWKDREEQLGILLEKAKQMGEFEGSIKYIISILLADIKNDPFGSSASLLDEIIANYSENEAVKNATKEASKIQTGALPDNGDGPNDPFVQLPDRVDPETEVPIIKPGESTTDRNEWLDAVKSEKEDNKIDEEWLDKNTSYDPDKHKPNKDNSESNTSNNNSNKSDNMTDFPVGTQGSVRYETKNGVCYKVIETKYGDVKEAASKEELPYCYTNKEVKPSGTSDNSGVSSVVNGGSADGSSSNLSDTEESEETEEVMKKMVIIHYQLPGQASFVNSEIKYDDNKKIPYDVVKDLVYQISIKNNGKYVENSPEILFLFNGQVIVLSTGENGISKEGLIAELSKLGIELKIEETEKSKRNSLN